MMGEGFNSGDNSWHQKSASEKLPAIRHELLVEKPPSGSSSVMEKNTVKNFVGAEISLPDGWKPSQNNRGTSRLTTYNSPGDSASLNLFDRGSPINAQSTEDFGKLLADNAHLTRPKDLTPAEIKKLSHVMGASNAGDNQYTNSAKASEPGAPAFHLFAAQLIPLNGRTALEVQGNFFTDTGAKGTEYRGVFVPSGPGGNRVDEFFMQADNAADAAKHLKDYKASLASIKW